MGFNTIFHEARACLEYFKQLSLALTLLPVDHPLPAGVDRATTVLAIEDSKARFRAWGTNIAAFHDSSFRTSLDFRLREAPDIVSRALQILRDLQEYLIVLTSILTGEKSNEAWFLSDLSDSSDDVSDKEVSDHPESRTSEVIYAHQDLLKAITTSLSSLMKLSMLVRSSASRDDYVKAASRYSTWSPYPDIGHVREKFGNAKYCEPWLLERLGKSITRRRQFLKYRVEHHNKMVEERAVERQDVKDDNTIASTKATTFIRNDNVVQNVQNAGSNFGGSLRSLTSYDPTVFGVDGTPDLLSVPSPPEFAFPDIKFIYGEPFQCPYCFTEQIVKDKSAWKKHVFQDLKPYVCTFEECDMLMFKDRKEWFAHELKAHRRQWFCQFCEHNSFLSKDFFTSHIKSAHQALLASSSLQAILLQSEEQVDRIPATACHLCNEWEDELRRKDASRNSNSSKITADKLYGPLKQFRRHMAQHMQQLALFALPKDETAESDEQCSDSDEQESSTQLEQSVPVLVPKGNSVIDFGSDDANHLRDARHESRNTRESQAAQSFNPSDIIDLKALKDALNAKDASAPAKFLPKEPISTPRRTSHGSMSRDKSDTRPIKSILRQPRAEFPEDPSPIREGVAPLKNAKKDGVPPDARWTKISRKLVDPEVLEAGKERYEARDDFVIVLRVLSRDEVQEYADLTHRLRATRGDAVALERE